MRSTRLYHAALAIALLASAAVAVDAHAASPPGETRAGALQVPAQITTLDGAFRAPALAQLWVYVQADLPQPTAAPVRASDVIPRMEPSHLASAPLRQKRARGPTASRRFMVTRMAILKRPGCGTSSTSRTERDTGPAAG